MIPTRADRVHLAAVLGVTAAALLLTGCPSQFGAINESTLTPQQKREAGLYLAEQGWVNAKTTLADAIDAANLVGVNVPASVKTEALVVMRSGNLALQQATAALMQGDQGVTAFSSALRALQQATASLNRTSGGL